MTEFASNTTFFASRVASQGVFATEVGTERAFFIGVVDGPLYIRK